VPLAAADPNPTIVPIMLLLAFTVGMTIWLVVAAGKSGAPGPADTAVAYEHAWDRLDFATLWNLSGPTLRDGRTRDQFVRDKLAAYEQEAHGLAGLVRSAPWPGSWPASSSTPANPWSTRCSWNGSVRPGT
jgi:hypothetical protein